MRGVIGTAMQALALRQRQWRRARNLRAGRAAPHAGLWLAGGAAAIVVAGGAVIAAHALHLRGAAEQSGAQAVAGVATSVDALEPVVPGASFVVPAHAGVQVSDQGAGAIVVVAGMDAAPPVKVDLCSQMLPGARGRLLPIRIGYQFDDVEKLVTRNASVRNPVTLRNIALAGPAHASMPQIQISGVARANFADPDGTALQFSWSGAAGKARWVSDAGPTGLRRDGWLIWPGAALRLHRRASASCEAAGELVLQLYRGGGNRQGRAMVTAFAPHAASVSAWLRPGSYTVPAAPRASLEDQALFQALADKGLVRLTPGGLAELAPRDLAAWQAASRSERAGQLDAWAKVGSDAATAKLFKRLHHKVDGAYIREQVRIFNNERRLLAWRVRLAQAGVRWQASAAGAPVATSGTLPLAAARLFADVPQGWAPWQRVAAWPASGEGGTARIGMDLPHAARGGERIEMLIIGQVQAVEGARLAAPPRGACSGRACPSQGSAQLAVLEVSPGARSIVITAAPLAMGALAGQGEDQYRHLRVAGGKLSWRALAANSGAAPAPTAAGANIFDRNGALLWSAGGPSEAARQAGLAPLLGLRTGHAASVSGMLARVPSPSGEPHSARLSLDLVMQKISHDALDCIGMRRGHWDGARCQGGRAAPRGRQAGIVILDTSNGDILAAAGVGGANVDAANWSEVRDFDRANPARSPLRLPAFQHDGGAHRSPGSTFKIVSALGLELAAQSNPQIDALLDGMALPAINRMAQQKGFAFQTAAATYPMGTRLAHITNYRDQQLDRRARDGRLGLSQALTYSLNTWFAWSGELSDRSLFGRADGGAPDLQALEPGALDSVRPIAAMAHRLGFEQEVRLDAGLLPADFSWSRWDALQASEARIDPIHTRHELRQMSIGLRMQTTPLHMAMVAGAVGQGRTIAPRLLLALDGRDGAEVEGAKLGVRLDRIRHGMKGVIDEGTAAGAFRAPGMDKLRRSLSGKTGTSPSIVTGPDGVRRELATVWFTGWLEPGSVPGQRNRLAFAAFVSHSEASGGEHAAPIVAAVLGSMAAASGEQKGK